ncbi:S-adenosyl-L-methionine-dependent methyltransferase, partial [Aureobasidium sp. EXF-3399]
MTLSDDESNGVFDIDEELVPVRELKQAGVMEVTFDGLLSTPLRLEEDLKKGCGGMLWPAGMVMAKYLIRQDKELFKDKTIVELGAGGGLVGLAVALGFHLDHPLHLTDQIPMLALMERNIALNNLQPQVKASIYDWGEPAPEAIPQHPDIILAAECVYFEPAFPLLQQTMKDLIGPNTICYFCFKKRRRADMNFVKVMKKMFLVEPVEDDPDKPSWSRENLHFFKVTLKQKKV